MEAAATPTTFTSLSDESTLEYVQKEVPLESQTPDLNENDAVVESMITKTVLPKYVIIQSNQNNTYLHLENDNPFVTNALRYAGEYSFDLDTRFEVVPATTGNGQIHVRSMKNNKYWANFGTSYNWITAMADKPEENQSDKNCTLFELLSKSQSKLMIRHVNTSKYVRFYMNSGQPSDGLLNLSSDRYDEDVCTFIDWESVVMLPELIRIKGVNSGNHLKAFADGFMDFSRQADNSSLFDYVVSPSRDGGICLKSAYFGTYWTDVDDSTWVLLKGDSPTVHDTNTVFLPMITSGNRIIIKSLKSGNFCNRHSADGKNDCLATLNNYPDDWSYMDIEEPVFSRKINNVRYNLTDARIYGEKSVALISDDSSNKTKSPLTSELNLKTTVTNTNNWSTSVSLKLGVKMTLTFGVPLIKSGSGEFEISGEETRSSQWGETETESIEVGSVRTMTLQPMTRLKTSLLATRVSYDIPFSYTQHDILMNGSKKVTEKIDGIFTGHNGYNYRYEVVQLPLE